MPLAMVDLPGHQQHTLPPLHHAQRALIVLVNVALTINAIYIFTICAVSRAARAYLYEHGRSIAHFLSLKTSRPARLLKPRRQMQLGGAP